MTVIQMPPPPPTQPKQLAAPNPVHPALVHYFQCTQLNEDQVEVRFIVRRNPDDQRVLDQTEIKGDDATKAYLVLALSSAAMAMLEMAEVDAASKIAFAMRRVAGLLTESERGVRPRGT